MQNCLTKPVLIRFGLKTKCDVDELKWTLVQLRNRI